MLKIIPFILLFLVNTANASDILRGAGSSTVFPFVAVIAEEYGEKSGNSAPIIEATGTGGGMKLFCSGIGGKNIDFTNASRQIKQSEIELCQKNGVYGFTEVQLGYDGIILANSTTTKQFSLTSKDIFLALAEYIPAKGKLIKNNNIYWSDIRSELPKQKISIYGPPPTSGTRDAFEELVMIAECKKAPEFKKLYPEKKELKSACKSLRKDNVYLEAGENDNMIIHKLKTNPESFGIFGYSFLEQNQNTVQGSIIDGFPPTFENIASKQYPIARSLFVYFKDDHVKKNVYLQEFLLELISEDAIGEEGYSTFKGLIPLSEDRLIAQQEKITNKFIFNE